MTINEKKEIYNSIMTVVSKELKRLLNEKFKVEEKNEKFNVNKDFLKQISKQSVSTLKNTYKKNIRIINNSTNRINEENGDDIEKIFNDIKSGNSQFGSHRLIDDNEEKWDYTDKDYILMAQNAYADLFHLYKFDDWQFCFSSNDGIYYMDILIPSNKKTLSLFLKTIKQLGYHYKIEKTPIVNYF